MFLVYDRPVALYDQQSQSIILEAAAPAAQRGSTGTDQKAGSLYGRVLGSNWGGIRGDWARYDFQVSSSIPAPYLHIRYARQYAGSGHYRIDLDGHPEGTLDLPTTQGWGDTPAQFSDAAIRMRTLQPGSHVLQITAIAPENNRPCLQPPVTVLDLVGNREDKNTVGHGVNVALYTGNPSQFFYSTYSLGDVFNAVDGSTIKWFPDYVLVDPLGAPGNANLDQITIDETPGIAVPTVTVPEPTIEEQRQVCVTKDDVAVSRVYLTNHTASAALEHIEIAGDCRGAADFRGQPGGGKSTTADGGIVVLGDKNALPNALKNGLVMAIGATTSPSAMDCGTAGAYRLSYDIQIPAKTTKVITFACAFASDADTAKINLAGVLKETDPVAQNRKDWKNFYDTQIPSFECSDSGLTELYDFRWFLLEFSRSGGNLGYLKYPVDLEGREAYQVYACYSAPFMAFDLNWAEDPNIGFGQLASLANVAYDDGRFPWYTTPETNQVHVDHPSHTGQSLLPYAAWKFYQIHGSKDLMAQIYPALKKNMDWWIADRDPDGNGLFSIDNQLETGMDDLHRRWKTPAPRRYEAVDATCYAVMNLRAVANIADILGKTNDASYYRKYAEKSSLALETTCWDPALERYRDRNPDTGELSDYNSITIFYPLLAGVAMRQNLGIINRYLLNPKEYWTTYPVPALSQSDPEFDPVHRYWAGPTWPATNSHVLQGFADTAKRLDRSFLPEVAELLHRMERLQLQPRADFYEHYDPFTGTPLSNFRDYMHSWWVDTIICQVAGLEPQDDGSLVIDPLPMGLTHFSLRNAPYGGHHIDVLWNDAQAGVGLVVKEDGKILLTRPDFRPGEKPIVISNRILTKPKPTPEIHDTNADNMTAVKPLILTDAAFHKDVIEFNAHDQELYPGTIDNDHAWDFLQRNVPLFDCPDAGMRQIYNFRWWSYRKHLRNSPAGWIVTEFLPDVPWAGKYNSISCAAAHHIMEGRWLADPQYMNDYSKFWFEPDAGEPRRYSSWLASAIYQRALVTGDRRQALSLLNDLVANYGAWEQSHKSDNGLFWQIDDRDGMEMSIGGSGYRATINSYMYGDATAISHIAQWAGNRELAASFQQKATILKTTVLAKLWDRQAHFFKVLPSGATQLVTVREEHGFTPWYFDMVPDTPDYSDAWRQLMDPQGFFAPYGPTTAERRDPAFALNYEGHECQWNGPSWPFATSITLVGMANLLNDYHQTAVSKADYFTVLTNYAQSQYLKHDDGTVTPWIDEDLNPDTGDWIARTIQKEGGHWSPVERGKDYNHSTFCDLVITGLVGLRPRADNVIQANPLVPTGTWAYFCLDSVPYHGHSLTILWDQTGHHYGKHKGLCLYLDGKLIATRRDIGVLEAAINTDPKPPRISHSALR